MDKITDTFINLNITKNGKTTTEIYLNDNELLMLLFEKINCSLIRFPEYITNVNRVIKILKYYASIEHDKLLGTYYQTKLDYHNQLKQIVNKIKRKGFTAFITLKNHELFLLKGKTDSEIVEEIFNTPKIKMTFLCLLGATEMKIFREERPPQTEIILPDDSTWEELFIWSSNNNIKQVNTIEQALDEGKAGYYITGYKTEHRNGEISILVCGTGKTVKEACEDLMEDFSFCPDQSCEITQQLKDFLQYIGFGFEFCLLPASEELVMLYESARFYELYNTGNHINMMMDTNTYVECFFDGKLAQPYFIK